MNLNALSSGTDDPHHRSRLCDKARWLADIICHLRDDLARSHPARRLPQNRDIQHWVAESYYPGLRELTWEEATLSLLSRMQRGSNSPLSKIDFASIATAQLRKATQGRQLWRF